MTKVQLGSLGLGSDHLRAFEAGKGALDHQVTLAHRDDEKCLCVYTDASDFVLSGIITQVPGTDDENSHSEKSHKPLTFLSGWLNDVQLGCSIF